jgi:protein-S-isoprenylcysteine O-methyltransferase Ste14
MQFNGPTVATCSIVLLGIAISTPVLVQGFTRRGTGVKYEKRFSIQRAPQLATLVNVILVVVAFLAANGFLDNMAWLNPSVTLVHGEPQGMLTFFTWLGVVLLASGMVFMIGGWYSLGDCFSTDAEVLDGQTVRNTGMLKYVMHPAYSGIIQSVLGASLAAGSPLSALITLAAVAPLWLQRAKYEEKILTETLGPKYQEYAENLRWRRLVPRIFPIGV